MKVLYKKDSKGKIRTISIWSDNGYLNQSSGLLDGKKVLHTKLCAFKNIGKSNETTPIEQANLEALAIIKNKLTEGYFETIEEAKNEVII